jgi:hypothetical protein
MKRFNLKKALAGEPVVTREGYKVTGLQHYEDADQNDFCITALIHGNRKSVETFRTNGSYNSCNEENLFDLFMAEPEKWVNIYYNPEKEECWAGHIHSLKEECEDHAVNSAKYFQQTIKLKL